MIPGTASKINAFFNLGKTQIRGISPAGIVVTAATSTQTHPQQKTINNEVADNNGSATGD